MTKAEIKQQLKQKALSLKPMLKSDFGNITYLDIARKSGRAHQTVKETFSSACVTCSVDVIEATQRLVAIRERRAIKMVKQ